MAATSPEVLAPATGSSRATDDGHVAALTGLRGFAALVVVAVHASGPTAYPWFGLHSLGPIALFVLSGFLLFQPWSAWLVGRGERPSVRRYAVRRSLRIFPAFWVTLLIVALIYPPSRPPTTSSWWMSLTLTQTASPTGLRPGLEHVWSLGTELAWYVALPVLGALAALAVFRLGLRPLAAVAGLFVLAFLITTGWRYYIASQLTSIDAQLTRPYWLPSYLVCFVGGALIAHLMVMDRYDLGARRPLRWVGDRPWFVIIAALVTGGVANSRLGGGWGWVTSSSTEISIRFAFSTLLALVLLAGVASPTGKTVMTSLFANRPMVAIGRWSYGLYLWHLPIRDILLERMNIPEGFGGLLFWFALLLAASVPVAAATYAFVERPAIGLSKRVTKRRPLLSNPRDDGPAEASARARWVSGPRREALRQDGYSGD